MHRVRVPLLAALVAGSVLIPASPHPLAHAQERPVRAVLFYSPTCAHCEQVITRVLPVIYESYGGGPREWSLADQDEEEPVVHLVSNGRLQILLIDASWPTGQHLYQASIQHLQLPADRRGVPQLVIGDSVLVGSAEIPLRLPGFIESGLGDSGEDWPRLAGLEELLSLMPPESGALALKDRPEDPVTGGDALSVAEGDREPEAPTQARLGGNAEATSRTPEATDRAPDGAPEATGATSETPVATSEAPGVTSISGLETLEIDRSTLAQRLGRDPLGNGISIAVLVAMMLSVAAIWTRFRGEKPGPRVSAAIPILCLVGLGVAGYLSFVEIRGVSAVCGPVGDCNAVQQSEYAIVLGLLPVGVLDLIGYAAILMVWSVARRARGRVASLASVGLLGMTLAGVLFSIYLTFVEPFVIGATCAWCIASAIIITLLMWLSAGPGSAAWQELRRTQCRDLTPA